MNTNTCKSPKNSPKVMKKWGDIVGRGQKNRLQEILEKYFPGFRLLWPPVPSGLEIFNDGLLDISYHWLSDPLPDPDEKFPLWIMSGGYTFSVMKCCNFTQDLTENDRI